MRGGIAILLLALLTSPAGAGNAPVTEFRLDNGMKVLVREDFRAPVVVSMVWYRVGSSYEHDGITGISHFLEHMMFKGTKKLAPGEFSEIIAANGGRDNAFTSRDYTAYFQRIAADRLEVALRLEADRMRNLRLLPEEFQKEREVVREERRLRTEDKPTSYTYERFNAAAFLNSPYRNPVIGWMEDIEDLTLDDMERWYELWYAPNNATLVVVGAVEAEEVHRLAKRYFGGYRPALLEAPKRRTELPHQGQRRVQVSIPAQSPYLLMGYKVPSAASAGDAELADVYALEVLASILDSGQAARLPQRVVRGREVAASAGAGYSLFQRLEGIFAFDGIPASGHSIEEVEAALRDEIAVLQDELVAAEELERVKAQVVADKVYERDSMMSMAIQIGIVESIGLDYTALDDYVAGIEAVTPDDVRAVARRYLVDDRLTVAVLRPTEEEQSAEDAL